MMVQSVFNFHPRKIADLTLISEEGIADMGLPENYFLDEEEEDGGDFLDENISSCDKVENCVILSEFEQNLSKASEENSNSYGFNSEPSGNSSASLSGSAKKKRGGLRRLFSSSAASGRENAQSQ